VGVSVRRKYRPAWERKELYDLVILLRGHGVSYDEIIDQVHDRQGVWLSKSHVSDWVNGKHHPYGSIHELPPTPVPELAYVIGVAKGDGSFRAQRWSYRLRLRVIDKEFAQEFDRCASVVTGSNRHSIQWLPKQGLWCVEVCSILLYRMLRYPFSRLKLIISHCRKCAAAFLRGFFDSEASISGRSLDVANSNFRVLSYVRVLLEDLRVHATKPRLAQKGGRFVIIKGRTYLANKNIYRLHVRAGSLGDYARLVGFAVRRKQLRLNSALAMI